MIKGNYEITKLLLKKGANVYIINNYYETALHLAAYHNKIEIIKLIIDYNNDPFFINMKDLMGKTSFHYACKSGNLEIVKLMMNYADLVIQDTFYSCPLHVAAFYGNLEVVKHLINHGNVDVNAKDSLGYTPLQYAKTFRFFNIIEVLTQYGGNVYQEDFSSKELQKKRKDHEDIILQCYL